MAIFRWTERGGPPAKPPRRRGFGSRLIEGFTKNELKGDVEFVYAPEGFECVIRFATKDLPTLRRRPRLGSAHCDPNRRRSGRSWPSSLVGA